MRIQAAYFTNRHPADPDIQARPRCYQIRIGLDEIYYHRPTIPTPTPTG
jgi:hypothetical protein